MVVAAVGAGAGTGARAVGRCCAICTAREMTASRGSLCACAGTEGRGRGAEGGQRKDVLLWGEGDHYVPHLHLGIDCVITCCCR